MNDSLIVTVRDVIIDDGGEDDPEEDGFLLWIMIIALVILVVIIVGMVLFFVLRKKKGPSGFVEEQGEDVVIPPETPSPEPTPEVSAPIPENIDPTQQPPVIDEVPIEKEVNRTPNEDIVMDPNQLEDPGSAL